MKKIFAFALVCGALMLGGCSTHSHLVTNHNLTQTQVVLTQKNFKVVGMAEGYASRTLVLGFGGCSEKAIRSNAIGEMFKNANLTGSQTIININVKKVSAGVTSIYEKAGWVATGTIIEFTE